MCSNDPSDDMYKLAGLPHASLNNLFTEKSGRKPETVWFPVKPHEGRVPVPESKTKVVSGPIIVRRENATK